MNLNTLKSAWSQYKLLSALQPKEHSEILAMVESFEARANSTRRLVVNFIMVLVIAFCCQG